MSLKALITVWLMAFKYGLFAYFRRLLHKAFWYVPDFIKFDEDPTSTEQIIARYTELFHLGPRELRSIALIEEWRRSQAELAYSIVDQCPNEFHYVVLFIPLILFLTEYISVKDVNELLFGWMKP